ncbi:MAG: hypothetical protein G8D81_15215 [gamma proteobacterium symbiont of Clathrolucina costata]|uniref:Uncharacterized protein n=1 Tax=Candidatus Thiodiazotropha taylori TaxID=2792791 RepID=A0A9E4TVN4_9GAMM|nr:hypothetical protein [Candidatus Thiodiazotropha taylori]MCW4239172.1 hypothetical protein [Candidatus Thiodiazotropha endolucinida]
MFEPLEKCVLNQYQYLVDEFQPDDNAQEIAMVFRNYCAGCIAMFQEINPDADFMSIRPFFSELEQPTPLQSLNEANHWVSMLAFQLQANLEAKNA